MAIKTPRLPLTLPIDGYNQKRIYINKYSPATYLTLLGLLANSFSLIFRYTRTGHPPLGNMFEFLLFFIWGIALTYLVIEFKYNLKQIGMFALPLIFALNSWLITMDTSLNPLMPALRSNWLYFHVFTAVVSYGAFAISFVIGLMYLIKDRFLIRNLYSNFVHALPELDSLEELSYKLILVGMPFLTLVIITGAIWAEMAWGTYWSWDPKETWSLITWFIYAAYLHTRFTKNLKGRLSIALVVIGFLAVLFTFAGVNILLPGLHSYA
ncbi:MAG: hypothetical protein JM58_15390 [Peptococcaceae bacterium BICA1-8]|nr:MAG: hypothetical protein JM58_15390 [Peptococcaceae bacterium BICA1-8]